MDKRSKFQKSNLFVLLIFYTNFILLISGCSFKNEKIDPNAENLRLQKLVTSSFDTLNEHVFRPKCLRCHDQATDKNHHINLSSYESIVNSKVFPPLVIPGDPENSSLYTSINENKMPKDGGRLNEHVISMLYQWIKNGALKIGSGKLPGEDKPGDNNDTMFDPFDCPDNAFECITKGEPKCDPDDFNCDEE